MRLLGLDPARVGGGAAALSGLPLLVCRQRAAASPCSAAAAVVPQAGPAHGTECPCVQRMLAADPHPPTTPPARACVGNAFPGVPGVTGVVVGGSLNVQLALLLAGPAVSFQMRGGKLWEGRGLPPT